MPLANAPTTTNVPPKVRAITACLCLLQNVGGWIGSQYCCKIAFTHPPFPRSGRRLEPDDTVGPWGVLREKHEG